MKKKNRHPVSQSSGAINNANSKPPVVSGQCAEVLELLRKRGPTISLELTANCAIPETAARVYDLRAKGWNIQTVIEPEVVFRGRIRRNVARYSLGVPEWPAPGFMSGEAA